VKIPRHSGARSRAAFSWAILAGLFVLPLLLMLVKAFPGQSTLWAAVMSAMGIVVAVSIVGYLRVKVKPDVAHTDEADA